jgi:aspartyl-tRNA(Asn)/glutamyl-tRNA(Gln) amidotransferase subunit C
MPIDKDEILRIARLGRLFVSEDEIGPLQRHLNGILEHFERLKGLDLEGIDPFAAEDEAGGFLREDEVASWPGREEVLQQAPKREGDFFRVPRILEENGEEEAPDECR